MKVLHIIPSIAPCRGGPSAAVLAMVRALQKEGVQADIVTTNDNGPALLPVATGTMQDYEGCRVCFLPRWSPGIAALREFQYSAEFTPWLRAALPSYDVLHVHAVFSYLSTRAMMLARAAGIRYINRPLGQLDAWSLGQKALKKRLYYSVIEGRNLAGASAIHCTSEAEAGSVRALLPEAHTVVIPHGIEPPVAMADAPARMRSAMNLPAGVPVILFLSRWHPKKNIPLLLEALAGMKQEPWVLVLAGTAEDGYSAIVQQAIQQYGLQDRVRCPGHVQGDEKALLLQGADAFVLPSSSENFGIAVAEALVNGLPVVTTPGVDLAPVVLELNGGFVCKPEVESLRSSLRQGLHRPNDKLRLSQDARRRFEWSQSARKLSTLYECVMEGREV